MKRFTLALLSFFLVAFPAAPQSNPDTVSGVVPFGGVSGGDFDPIGIGNGGLFFRPRLWLTNSGGQLRLSFNLQYSSKSWSVNGPGAQSGGGCSITQPCNWNYSAFGQKHDAPQFTLKTGTIFEDSPIGLDKWLTAMWQIVNCKNGVSSYEVHRAIGITQKSAWFMDHRIRLALGMGHSKQMAGEVEVDETYIGGKARNMHIDVKKRRITATGPTDKTAVFGVLERGNKDKGTHSKVKTVVVPNRKKKTLQAEVKAHVQAGSALYSDALLSYDGLEPEYAHQVVDHAVEYVRDRVHTNGMENFWCLFKRGINGTYVSVEPFHLFRYLDEQEFRFNNRGNRDNPVTDGERFDIAVRQIVGKRLIYKALTGKTLEEARQPF